MSGSLIFVASLVVKAEGVVSISGSCVGITSTVVVPTSVCFVDSVNIPHVVSVSVCVVEVSESIDVERIAVKSLKDSVVGLTFSVVVSCAVMSGSLIFVASLVVKAEGVVLISGSCVGITSTVVVPTSVCFVDSVNIPHVVSVSVCVVEVSESIDVERIAVKSLKDSVVGLTFSVVVSCAVMSVSLIFVAPLVVNAEGVVLMSGSVAGITSTVVVSTSVCFVDSVNVTCVVSVSVSVVEVSESIDVEWITVKSLKDSVVWLTFPVVVSCAVMSVSLIFVAPLVVNAEGVVLMSGSVAGITSTVVVSKSVCFVDSVNATRVVSVLV
ncbi:uncharacterized protein LOC125705297 [Brienomyrus brachyistius]|uniref:uncharacterized protein LOC125705297 n=1 Tax=Brienomyrus brachyistius TaxID=42636 RepID=UPI0020B2B9FE|nr:uncharacterized protein LOC125705297 [Brienomyrus brachyistius]